MGGLDQDLPMAFKVFKVIQAYYWPLIAFSKLMKSKILRHIKIVIVFKLYDSFIIKMTNLDFHIFNRIKYTFS